ncbi:hypothetical protein RBB50_010922 [Rhinocladiella similis]
MRLSMPQIDTKAILADAKAKATSVKAWELPKGESSVAPPDVWSNIDQDPVPPERRTWSGWSFLGYWFSDLADVNGWLAGSSVLAVGLTWRECIPLVLVGGLCNSIPMAFNGTMGARLRVSFPVAVRASFGYWFSYFCVVSRLILCLFWFGVNCTNGGSCVTQMLTAIWPSYANIPNHVPESVGMTTQGFCSYFLFFLLIFPLLFIPVHKLGPLLFFKAVTVAPMALIMVIYLTAKAGGAGPLFDAKSELHGSEKVWTCFSVLMSIIGGYTTLTVNISDFSRFAKTPSAVYTQIPSIPILKLLTYMFGIIGTSAAQVVYGTQIWNPLEIVAQWQGSSGGRAAAFFCSLIWLFSVLTVNLTGNAICASHDFVTLFPKYLNIRRGSILAATLGAWAFAPWKILASAITFLNFMASYVIFLAPMAGIMICDYWFVKRCKIDVPQLYDPRGIYRYWKGVNWRAAVVMVVAVAPVLPGMIHAINNNILIGTGLTHLYNINWIYGTSVSVFLYWAFNAIKPDRATLIPRVVEAEEYLTVHGELGPTEVSSIQKEAEVGNKEV